MQNIIEASIVGIDNTNLTIDRIKISNPDTTVKLLFLLNPPINKRIENTDKANNVKYSIFLKLNSIIVSKYIKYKNKMIDILSNHFVNGISDFTGFILNNFLVYV